MNPRVAPLLDLYKINTRLINKAIMQFREEDYHKRINDTGNSIHWMLGHITNSRNYVGEIFGASSDFPGGDTFSGGQPLKELSEYPSISEVKKTFETVSEKVLKRLAELTDDDINENREVNLPVDDDTKLGAIAFFSLHESYHVGQLSYLGRQLGYKSLTG